MTCLILGEGTLPVQCANLILNQGDTVAAVSSPDAPLAKWAAERGIPQFRRLADMTEDPKADLHRYLQVAREAALWKLDGLSEYDSRRPMTPTGTNLLGLVKHSATWEARYFGEVFGRPFPEPLPRWDDEAASGADLWVTRG